MYDWEERGVRYPITPEWDSADAEESDRVTFACREAYEWLNIDPTPATAHIEDKRTNYFYNRSFSQTSKTAIAVPDIREALSTGWILPAQVDIKLNVSGDTVEAVNAGNRRIVSSAVSFQPEGSDDWYYVVTARLFWVPLVTEGCSLLITHPGFADDAPFRTLSQVVDVDQIPMRLDVKLLVQTESGITINHGYPLAQVIPIPRSTMQAETRIVDSSTEKDQTALR